MFLKGSVQVLIEEIGNIQSSEIEFKLRLFLFTITINFNSYNLKLAVRRSLNN